MDPSPKKLAQKYDALARRFAKRAAQFASIAAQQQPDPDIKQQPSAAEPRGERAHVPKQTQRQVQQTERAAPRGQTLEQDGLPAHEVAARSLQRATELEAQARAERERAAQAARQVKVEPPSFESLPPHARPAARLRWELSQLYGGQVLPEFAMSGIEAAAARGAAPTQPVLPEGERIRREGQDALFSRAGVLPANQRRVPRKG